MVGLLFKIISVTFGLYISSYLVVLPTEIYISIWCSLLVYYSIQSLQKKYIARFEYNPYTEEITTVRVK